MIRLILTIIIVLFGWSIHAQSNENLKRSGFIDFNGYYDTRNYSEVTINILNNFPVSRLHYFSFVNFTGQEENTDLSTYFSEQNLRWRISTTSPIYLHAQLVVRNGQNNDAIRFGVRWAADQQSFLKDFMKKIHFQYALALFAIEYGYSNSDHWFTQLEHAYRISILNSKLYISGFADQNFRVENNTKYVDWVTEHQIGIKIIDQFYIVSEYRINDYLLKSEGWGFGLEYKMVF